MLVVITTKSVVPAWSTLEDPSLLGLSMFTNKDLKSSRSVVKQKDFIQVNTPSGCSSFSFFESLIRFLNDVK